MTGRTLIATTLFGLCAFAAALAGDAGSEGGFDLSWNTIDGGGGASTGGAFELAGTIGQHDASQPLTGGGYELTGGFWPGAGPLPLPTCPADISPQPNGDGVVNVNDLLLVIGNWGAVGENPADINNDNVVNVNDLLAVVGTWGACP